MTRRAPALLLALLGGSPARTGPRLAIFLGAARCVCRAAGVVASGADLGAAGGSAATRAELAAGGVARLAVRVGHAHRHLLVALHLHATPMVGWLRRWRWPPWWVSRVSWRFITVRRARFMACCSRVGKPTPCGPRCCLPRCGPWPNWPATPCSLAFPGGPAAMPIWTARSPRGRATWACTALAPWPRCCPQA